MIVPDSSHLAAFTMSNPSTTSVAPIPTVIPGAPVFQELHDTGKRTLWVVTALMGLSSLVFYTLSARAPLSKRVFHTLTSLITTISFFVYLALATGQGITWKHIYVINHHKHVPNTTDEFFRQVLWLRYVNWALTTPLILINFALVSGLPGANMLVAIAANLAMLAAGLLGSFAGHTPQRWVWLTLSCISYLVMLHHGGFHAQRAVQNKDDPTRRFFTSLSGSFFAVFALFPISLAAGALALKASVDAETVILAIVDIFTQGLLGYWLLLSHDSTPGIGTLYLDGFWSQGVGNEGAIRIEDEEGA
ncbi:Rhodopsin archaeal/bacterial/fungal [Penicillium macrosclerotiorum]|uniref:Rhodopsin archaeal/bacterial/fungal n=1 Tax=Penicillium macrosclerotiorum TaxID=303699 RepID=UPI0025467FAD|nr:Rhodopsin archaeal/bacterial/fungal [Penicillium macrosclerotiorum]KAJ5698079.1 Rhodopsin archaeal/bacterial/fungal [Penicillium macrosclerotiorum]